MNEPGTPPTEPTAPSAEPGGGNESEWRIPTFETLNSSPMLGHKATAPNDGLTALVTAVRWGTTTVGLLWATALRSDSLVFALGIVLLAYSLWRTFRPVEYGRRGWKSLLSIITDLAITVGVVVASDCWDSPYIFALFTSVIAAGFARGFWHAFRVAVTAAVAVGLAAWLLDLHSGIRPVMSWSGELLLVAAVASYGRRLLTRAEEVRALNLSQLWRLSEANTLLVGLNRLAHDLPVSFDFQDTVGTALSRVREVTRPDLSILLLPEPANSSWNVAMCEGTRLPLILDESRIPAAAIDAAYGREPRLVALAPKKGEGFDESSRSGIYVPLWTGSRQVGLLAVESRDVDRFGTVQLELLRELAEPVALTIDNARWFERLRARGAAQERNRIARDLHDRVGQGVAYVAFELDRLSASAKGTELEDDIENLRTDARSMVRELRETLYDLRADVSDQHDLVETIQEFLDRVSARSGLLTRFTQNASRRLPLAQEREVWRICQEAIVNAERHAEATSIQVHWNLDDNGGQLEVIDDGVGVHVPDDQRGTLVGYGEASSPGRPSYGLTGMRERADAIGAVLEVAGGDPVGTVVRLRLGDRQDHGASTRPSGATS